jgi:CarD family transcriptional regulator
VSQKTRKKSISKASKKTAAATRVVAKKTVSKAVTKSAAAKAAVIKPAPTKGRAGSSVKDTRSGAKAVAAKPSKNQRSAMPNKTAKPAPKAAASKPAAATKPAAPKTAVKAAAPKTVETKAVEAKAPEVKAPEIKAAAPAVKAAAPKEVAKVAAKPVAAKPAAPAAPVATEPKKPLTQRQGFKTNEFVVYPAHGVGQILAIEEQEIAGAKLELFVINFMKDKMTLRVPTAKVANVGMRKLSEPALVKKALETLKGRARIKRTMWSRRAQEYEAKINSGDIVAIAEVVRDLFRSDSQPEQSYSERQLYEAALDRLSREIAVVQHVTETEAVKEIEGQLAKSPRRGAKAEAGAEAGADDADSDGDDDVAAADEAA